MNLRHEEIFATARSLPETERESYLVETCQSDEERQRVAKLLDMSFQADDFFAGLDHAEQPKAAHVAEEAGDLIGPYTLMRKLGEGGFGVVFEAQQHQPIARTVALKIIKQGMDTQQVITRFEAERQALAIMDHANIARVIDAGATATGRPYFAMELVQGKSITDFCDHHTLDLRQRLDLFLVVCAAVAHAHQKGIIHRDLKPSNILVTESPGSIGEPKVIDFGIAKALQEPLTGDALVTRVEQFLGTPVYVSPEQASTSPTDVDTRSDIYSLGIILYELLTGTTPFDPKRLHKVGLEEMRRILREEDPPKPSTRLSETNTSLNVLRRELDWIVLKAIEKDPDRRYGSADQLAQDIRHFLADEPVSAVAPSLTYKLRKLVRRHRPAFAAAAAVMLALTTGLALALSAWADEKQARHQQDLAQDRAKKSEIAIRQISSILQEILASIDPQIAQGRDTSLMRDYLDRATARLENEVPANTPEGIDIRLTIAKVYNSLDQVSAATKLLRIAQRGAESLGDPSRQVEILIELEQAEQHSKTADIGVRLAMLRKALKIGENALGPQHRLSILAKSRLGGLTYGSGGEKLALEASQLADRYLQETDPVQASAFANYHVGGIELLPQEEQLDVRRQLVARFHKTFGDNDPKYARVVSDLGHLLCQMAEDSGDQHMIDEALDLQQQADSLMRNLLQPGQMWRTIVRWRLAMIQLVNDDLEAAKDTQQEAIDERRKSDGPYPRKADLELAWMLTQRGLHEEADTVIAARSEDPAGREPITQFWLQRSFACGEWGMAENQLTGLIERFSKDGEVELWIQSPYWLGLAAVYLQTGNHAAYDDLRKRMVKTFAQQGGPRVRIRAARVYFSLPPISSDSPITSTAIELARSANSTDKRSALALGITEFRLGNFEAALRSLESVPQAASNQPESMQALTITTASAYLTMANQELGQTDLAYQRLATARQQLDQSKNNRLIDHWHHAHFIFAKAAIQEASDQLKRPAE